GQQHRTTSGEQRGGQLVVCSACGCTGQQVRCGRGDHDEVRLLPQGDVADRGHVREHIGGDRVPGQRLEGGGPDEFQGRRGGDDGDVTAGLREEPDQTTGLVGGDTAPDPDDDACTAPVVPGRGHSPSAQSRRSEWSSRRAMVSGFSWRPGSTSGPTYSRIPSSIWL